jgi:hypothetical protein
MFRGEIRSPGDTKELYDFEIGGVHCRISQFAVRIVAR